VSIDYLANVRKFKKKNFLRDGPGVMKREDTHK
jgi:hypothetical protein